MAKAKAATPSTTRTCTRCGGEFKVDNPRSRRKVCNSCKARNRRRNGGGGGGRRTFSAARVLARSAPPGGYGGSGGTGGGTISVNTSFYRREPFGLPPTVVLRGNGTLTALKGSGGWKDAVPGTSLDQMALYLTNWGYVLADVVEHEGELELTYTRNGAREVSHA